MCFSLIFLDICRFSLIVWCAETKVYRAKGAGFEAEKAYFSCFSLVLSLKATILRSFGSPREGHALEAHFHHFEAVSKRAVF